MKIFFSTLAGVSMVILSGCDPVVKPTGNPVLTIVSNVDCALLLGDPSGNVELMIKNIGTENYGGGGEVYVTIDGNKNTSLIPSILIGDTESVSVVRPAIAGGDWSGGVGIANQPPTSVSCIG